MGSVDSWNIVVERTLGTLWGAALAWLICALTDRLRTQEFIVPGQSSRGQPPRFSHQLRAAARITLGAAIPAGISHPAGWPYPAWAAIGPATVLQGRPIGTAPLRERGGT